MDKRIYYDCKWSRQCPKRMMLQIPHDSQTVLMLESEEPHNHELTTVGLPEETKTAIKEIHDFGIRKPKAILKSLREKGLEPKKSQLESFLCNLRSKEGGSNCHWK